MITRDITILIVDDDEVDRTSYIRMLDQSNHTHWKIHEAATGKEAIAMIDKTIYDGILLDYQLPDMNGIEILQYIKNKYGEYVAVIMLTGHGSEDIAVTAMKKGAIDYLVKSMVYSDILFKTITNSIKTLELKKIIHEQNDQIEYYRFSDSLTGLKNRHTFEEMAKQAYSDCLRHNDKMAVIFIDVEQFTTINDSQGRMVGDEILIEISKRLKDTLPVNSIIGRWGNDEFAVLLTGFAIEKEIEKITNKITTSLKEPITLSTDILKININIGVACYPRDSSDLGNLLKNALMALNQAKMTGSGTIVYFSKNSVNGQKADEDENG